MSFCHSGSRHLIERSPPLRPYCHWLHVLVKYVTPPAIAILDILGMIACSTTPEAGNRLDAVVVIETVCSEGALRLLCDDEEVAPAILRQFTERHWTSFRGRTKTVDSSLPG